MDEEMLLLITATVVLAALAWIGLRPDPLRRPQSCHFVCPRSGDPVYCQIVQDIRTGQWKGVQSCSAYPRGWVECGQDCARLMNLGFRLPAAGRT